MLWLYMCFSDEAHIRVPTLRNHILHNNSFAKLIMDEPHLPFWSQLGPLRRTVRFLYYLLTLTMAVAQITCYGMHEIKLKKNSRDRCSRACQETHFPLLGCSVIDGITVKADGNEYSRVFHYFSPEFTNDKPCVDSSLAMVQLLQPCHKLHSVGKCSEKRVRELCKQTCNACDKPSPPPIDPIKRSDAIISRLRHSIAELPESSELSQYAQDIQYGARAAVGDSFFGEMVGNDAAAEFLFCRERAMSPWGLRDVPGQNRKEKLHTCFSLCRTDKDPVDSRQLCTESVRPYDNLLCVAPDEPAPDTNDLWGPKLCVTDTACVSLAQIFIIIFLSTCVQTVNELMMYYAADLDEIDGFWDGAYKCGLQTSLAISGGVLLLAIAGPVSLMLGLEKMGHFWVTLVVGLFADQVANVLFQPLVHRVVVLQMGNRHPGIQEYNAEYIEMWPLDPPLFETLQGHAKEKLESTKYKMFSMAIVMVYACFVLLQIQFKGLIVSWNEDIIPIFNTIHLIILCIYFMEIGVHWFAYGMAYWNDRWTAVDNGVIIVSFAMTWFGVQGQSIILLRMIKPMRVLMMYRRKSDKRKKQKEMKDKSVVSVGSNVEKVLEMIEELLASKVISQHHREELEWIEQVIIDNKLYTVDVAADENGGGADGDMNAWLAQSVAQSEELKKAKEEKSGDAKPEDPKEPSKSTMQASKLPAASRMGGKSRMGSRVRSSKVSKSRKSRSANSPDEEANEKDQFMTQLFTLAGITSDQESGINETLRNFDTWNMDSHPLIQLVEGNALPIIFLQIVMRKELHTTLQLDFELLFNISRHVQSVANAHVAFNTPAQLCLNVHSVYYLTVNHFEKLIDDLEMFVTFFSVLVSKYQHPGLTNDFLVKTRHGRALRYNDSSVQESHVLANVTKLLSNPEYNFLILLEPLHVDAFRKLMIALVLKLDIAKHFDLLSRLQTKLASDRYPNSETWLAFVTKYTRVPKGDECDDRITLLFTLFRCADLSWACKSPALSCRWADRFTEELFAMGDVEKQVGVPISPFSDRDIVQPQKCQIAFLVVVVYPVVTQYIFTLRSQEGKNDIRKEDVDALEKELVEQGIEATRGALNQKALQGGGAR
jgi:hypothetical protein